MRCHMVDLLAYLREGTVVPQIALMWEAVTNETEFALLDVLLDGVEGLLFGDLYDGLVSVIVQLPMLYKLHWGTSSTCPIGIAM
jgi:hypothetical protein